MATARKSVLLEATEEFVKLCANIFKWGDLSEETVMDVGCGKELYCSRTVLRRFPNVKSIIALDCLRTQIEGITFQSPRITHLLADIQKRTDILEYEGKIDKVIASHVLHLIPNKEEAFRNVYRLLKPGGQAAFLFTADFSLYHVLKALKEDPKYKDYFKSSNILTLYSSEIKASNYTEMLEIIGFKVVEIIEEKERFLMKYFGTFKKTLYDVVAKDFAVPSELVYEINNAAAYLYRSRHCDQKSCYAATEMSIFVTKPSDSDTGCSRS